MRRIGFLINPVAGMGGSVGLKGTDGNVEEARRRGALPRAQERAGITLRLLAKDADIRFTTCAGAMGASALRDAGIRDFRVVYQPAAITTTEDTKEAVAAFLREGIDLILFCGGDGTARDVFSIAGRTVPLLGIPAGVKMYSAVFALDPATAAGLVSGSYGLQDGEIMDVDENAYREGVLETHLSGIARVPSRAQMTQTAKQVFEEADEDRAKEEIARFLLEVMLPGVLYVLGAGTTTEAIARRLGIKKTLLGVDTVRDGNLIAADANEKALLDLVSRYPETRIILSPIGAQGFILGRGNQQISASVVRRVGLQNLIIVATPHKLQETPLLYVDSGDPGLDQEFGESIQVISGYRIARRRKIARFV
ncbi:ATP-NAD kinase family protein [Methanoregula sp.]|uniref:ATP-NAD kinase family protein n=1 Tax=Methanoregula sp. TaxID=2052170 RepID=UPI002C140579|nr:ATP-NAD kinase family protein [Methanoregula sp.]HVP95762.1 ATP-NAD kinase family protein [Methanoregula sp.]